MKGKLLLFGTLTFVFVSCQYLVRSAKGPQLLGDYNNQEIIKEGTQNRKSEPLSGNPSTIDIRENDNSRILDFFGIQLQGKYDDIIQKIYELPILSLIERRDSIKLQGTGDYHFSHTIEFCGVQWGMNADFTVKEHNIMSIHNLTFITSQTDDDIIDRVVAELTKYYGEPKWSDDREDRYDWYESNDLCITARHFRAPEGGWTFYFYIN